MSSPVPLLGCRSIIDVLRHMTEDGPEWAHRYVTLWFQNPPNAWVLVYPLQDTTEAYFDFMYTGTQSPKAALPTLLAKYPQCDVIDWSPGRLACISAPATDIETLEEIIQDLAQEAWGERGTLMSASYEQTISA